MMILLTKLLLAHLAGDFILQPASWVIDKQEKKARSPKLYAHVLLHGVLAFIAAWDPAFWLPALVILLSHYTIDLCKVYLERPNHRLMWFVGDQALHLTVIALVWYSWQHPTIAVQTFPLHEMLIVTTAAVFLTNPTSILIRTFISQWTPETFQTVGSSLPDAGKVIGFLERLLVLVFILNGHWESVGFLLAAKSVFRFGNLRESHDRKLTEYVLIGTFLSFSIAVLVSLSVSALLIDR